MLVKFQMYVMAVVCALGVANPVLADTESRTIAESIDAIQNFTAPQTDKDFEKANEEADKRWWYLENHLEAALPQIRSHIRQHLQRRDLSDFAIIDLGYFCRCTAIPKTKPLL
ncbi:MAG: hypothetical protein QF893_02245 [Alphaproteobacteria bacterium]|jgi:hypothetical protein|nr:hypothetical protein [Alphaproteobacteria bacterium]